MPIYGHARVSTFDQNLAIQRAALRAASCGVVRAEKASGTRRDVPTEMLRLTSRLSSLAWLVTQVAFGRAKPRKAAKPSACAQTSKGLLRGGDRVDAIRLRDQDRDLATAAVAPSPSVLAAVGDGPGNGANDTP